MKTLTKDSEIYLAAAAGIAAEQFNAGYGRTEGACDVLGSFAIEGAFGRPDLRDSFRYYFVDQEGYFLMDEVCDGPQETKAVRILALCFMAAIAESEGR